MTIVIDDAGMGDLLFGVVIGAFRCETQEFRYEILDVKFFKQPRFRSKDYLKEASKIVFRLLDKLQVKEDEPIQICQGYVFDDAVNDLKKKYDEHKISRIRVTGEPQRLTETAYLDEIRNLGYEPIKEREKKRAKSFFHMKNWLEKHPDRIIYAKTGWPRLCKYPMFGPSRTVDQTKNKSVRRQA